MTVSSTESLHKLDAILYGRPAGRNIIDYAIETIKELREQGQTRQRDESDGAMNALTDQYTLLAEERNALKAEVERMTKHADKSLANFFKLANKVNDLAKWAAGVYE